MCTDHASCKLVFDHKFVLLGLVRLELLLLLCTDMWADMWADMGIDGADSAPVETWGWKQGETGVQACVLLLQIQYMCPHMSAHMPTHTPTLMSTHNALHMDMHSAIHMSHIRPQTFLHTCLLKNCPIACTSTHV